MATLLIQNGTLHKGDCVIAGTAVGRVRTMRNDKGQDLTQAGPSMPVEITGLTEVPDAGDIFEAVADERLARELADKRTNEAKERQFAAYTKVTLDNLFDQMAQNDMKELPIVVKADVQGSAEAVKQSLEKLSNDEVRVRVIHAGVAPSASPTSRWPTLPTPSSSASTSSRRRGQGRGRAGQGGNALVPRHLRRINDVSDAMKGMLAPKIREVALARRRSARCTRSPPSAPSPAAASPPARSPATPRSAWSATASSSARIPSPRSKRFKDDAKEVAEGFEWRHHPEQVCRHQGRRRVRVLQAGGIPRLIPAFLPGAPRRGRQTA